MDGNKRPKFLKGNQIFYEIVQHICYMLRNRSGCEVVTYSHDHCMCIFQAFVENGIFFFILLLFFLYFSTFIFYSTLMFVLKLKCKAEKVLSTQFPFSSYLPSFIANWPSCSRLCCNSEYDKCSTN